MKLEAKQRLTADRFLKSLSFSFFEKRAMIQKVWDLLVPLFPAVSKVKKGKIFEEPDVSGFVSVADKAEYEALVSKIEGALATKGFEFLKRRNQWLAQWAKADENSSLLLEVSFTLELKKGTAYLSVDIHS